MDGGATHGRWMERTRRGLEKERTGDGEGGHWGTGASAPLTPRLLCAPQPFPCAEDEDCGPEEFCGGAARGGGAPLCLGCRRRRKRCLRDAMCCPGMACSNGEHRAHPGLGAAGGAGVPGLADSSPLPPQVSARPWSRPTERPSWRRRALRHCPDGRPPPPGSPLPKVRSPGCCHPSRCCHPALLSPGICPGCPLCISVPVGLVGMPTLSRCPARDQSMMPFLLHHPPWSRSGMSLSLLSPWGRSGMTPSPTEDKPGVPILPVGWSGMLTAPCGVDQSGVPTPP